MTAAAALVKDAAATLAAAGVPAPEWDAERLLRHVLGWDRAALVANPDRVVPEPEAERFRALVRRRASREPLQYILGTQAFWKHEFLVTPAVLIPRPETELLVETSLELLKDVERPLIVDVGTGSGCIALSLAAERPDAEVHAIDISAPALAVARENARRLGLEGRVAFHHGDLLEPVAHLAGRIDLVVSNPPYVDPDGPRVSRAGGPGSRARPGAVSAGRPALRVSPARQGVGVQPAPGRLAGRRARARPGGIRGGALPDRRTRRPGSIATPDLDRAIPRVGSLAP